jgi:pyruvate-ferredoxin/flavodoxin oxidoreductase
MGKRLLSVVDHLIRRSIWLVGRDDWACDIAYALAQGREVNVLVPDTELYSNIAFFQGAT